MSLSTFLPPSVSIPIDAPLLTYLLSDDTRLPRPPAGARLCAEDPRLPLQRAGDDASFFSEALPTAEAAVSSALASLGGDGAFPRACGVAPVDGGWASSRCGGPGEALRCGCAGEVWALLKASARVRDAAAAAAAAPGAAAPPRLVLQRWLPGLQPQLELRCLVARGALAGVRQRLCGAPPPAAARAVVRERLHRLLAEGGLAAALHALGDACTIDVHAGGAAGDGGGLLLLGAGPAGAYWGVGEDPRGVWEEEGSGEAREGGGGSGGSCGAAAAAAAGALGFHPLAAHGFPAELYHFAAERVAAVAGSGMEPGQEAGGLLSELAAGNGAELGGGWQALIASLEERGAFGGADSDGSACGEGGGGGP